MFFYYKAWIEGDFKLHDDIVRDYFVHEVDVTWMIVFDILFELFVSSLLLRLL